MAREFLEGVSARIVRQIEGREIVRRVWVARLPARGNGYRLVGAPTRALPQLRAADVWGLACAETPAGRARIAAALEPFEPVLWREIPIGRARRLARRLADERGGVVHLALHDEPDRLVWEPTSRR